MRYFFFRPLVILFVCSFILSFRPADGGSFRLSTQYFTLELDGIGNLVHLTATGGGSASSGKTGGKDYIPEGHSSPLLSLYKDSVYYQPVSASYNAGKKRITLKYSNGSVAIVSIINKEQYLRFGLISLQPRQGIQAVVWGPYATGIQESIGETICVVHDADFAVGAQALNINTIEGLPEGNDNIVGGSFIDPLPGQYLPDSLKNLVGKPVPTNVNVDGDMPAFVRMYRGDAAIKRPYGSDLRLFARDRRMPRILDNGGANNRGVIMQYVSPVDVDFAGSAIAFFGCPEPKVLDVIERIELNEGLPHPMLDGAWIKRSPIPGQAYLMYEGKDPAKGVEYAKQAGFKLIHLGDLFQSWGHFGLKTERFPGGAPDIQRFTAEQKKDGLSFGVHTLTMFTGTNDPYVSPVPSDSLAKSGSTLLVKPIGPDDAVIYIQDPTYLRNLSETHTIKIGKELINYRAVSTDAPWRLLDCKRGQFKSEKSNHAAGTTIDKLINNSYKGFYPDIHLQDAYATRLASVCNETGLGLMDFDGYGGESPTGQGTYGAARFIDRWYHSLNKYVLTCGAGTFHYYWHIYSFMNWGEPWYDALRQSQVNYRIENQRYFTRNFMPHMLGWFSIDGNYRPEDIEWIQVRSVAFDAGYLMNADEELAKNGFRDELLALVKEWQEARNAHVFSASQLERFKDPATEFHLQKTGEHQWSLYPISLQSKFEHRFRNTQTGEVVSTHLTVKNPYNAQPFQAYIVAKSVEGNTDATVSNLSISVNNYQDLVIPDPIHAGDKLIIDGKTVWLCDRYWKKVREIKTDIPNWTTGDNSIVITSDFSGSQAPVLKLDFKCVGPVEQVNQ